MEWKDTSVTRPVYRKLLLEKVVPAIIEKWPRGEWTNRRTIIRIQQDGPQCHIKAGDEEWEAGLIALGVGDKILIYTQPSNSPDLNINDLGFFRALQAVFSQFCPKNTEEIVEYVLKAHELYPKERINHIWLSLMTIMNEIIDSNGNNSVAT